MRQTNIALALLAAAILSACGSSDGDNSVVQPPKPKFASQVSFGDSLSDVGTLRGRRGRRPARRQVHDQRRQHRHQRLADRQELDRADGHPPGLAAPCAAVTGLDGDASRGFSVPVTNNLNCTGYAQGGARVTNPVGPQQQAAPAPPLGQLTYPVATQVATHLARNGGKFKGDEVVFVMAGGNDALALLGELTAAATAAGNAAGAAEGAKVGAQTFATTLAQLLAAGATNPTTAAQAIGAAIAAESARARQHSTDHRRRRGRDRCCPARQHGGRLAGRVRPDGRQRTGHRCHRRRCCRRQGRRRCRCRLRRRQRPGNGAAHGRSRRRTGRHRPYRRSSARAPTTWCWSTCRTWAARHTRRRRPHRARP